MIKSKKNENKKPEVIIDPDNSNSIEVKHLKKYFTGKNRFNDIKAVVLIM